MADRCRECGGPVDAGRLNGLCAACLLAEAPRASQPSQSPDLAGHGRRYEEICEHARGGMGRVLIVYDTAMDRDVAVKELLPPEVDSVHGNGSHLLAARFVQEARVMGRLEHPSIVPVYEIGMRDGGRPYYSMPFISGRGLDEALRSSKTLVDRLGLLNHFVDLCQAIAYAHNQGVLHRDIKPANVMIGSLGETVVIDWGLAKIGRSHAVTHAITTSCGACTADGAYTRDGESLGTPVYMSPEQARGDLEAIDESTDVYALGAVLYEYLAGHPPYEGDSAATIIAQVLEGSPQPLRVAAPTAPAPLAAICERAMQRDKTRRYADVEALVAEVNRFRSGALVQSHDYTLRELATRFFRRFRKPILFGAVALAILLAVGVYSYVNILDARDAEMAQRLAAERDNYYLRIRASQTNIESLRFDAARDILSDLPESRRNWEWGLLTRACYLEQWIAAPMENNVTALAVSASGAFLAGGNVEGQIKAWRVSGPDELWSKRGHAGKIQRIRFHPDSERFLTVSRDGTAKMWHAERGELLAEYAAQAGPVEDAAFLLDGNRFVTASQDRKLRLWQTNTGECLQVLENHAADILRVQASPDARLFISADKAGHAVLWDAGTGQLLATLDGHSKAVRDVAFSPNGRLAATAGADGNAVLWAVPDGTRLHMLDEHTGPISTLAFNPDGTRLVTGSEDRYARIWDTITGRSLHLLEAYNDSVEHVRYTPDGTRILTGTFDAVVRVSDAESGAWITTLLGANTPLSDLIVTPDNRHVLVAPRQWVRMFDIAYGDSRAGLWGLPSCANSVFYSPDGTEIVGLAGYVWEFSLPRQLTPPKVPNGCVWDAHAYRLKRTLPILGGSIVGGAYVNGQLRLITHDARVWDGTTGAELFGLRDHPGEVKAAAFSPNAEYLITIAMEHPNAVVWDGVNGDHLRTLSTEQRNVECIALSPDGTTVAVAPLMGDSYLFDAATGRELGRLAQGRYWVLSLEFSHDGTRLACGTGSWDAFIWDVHSRSVHASLRGHGGGVRDIAFSPDDTRVVTSGEFDYTARIWDPDMGVELVKLAGNIRNQTACAWSPDGRTVIAADSAGQARVWEAATWKLDELPGTPDRTWEERFFVYRDAAMLQSRERHQLH